MNSELYLALKPDQIFHNKIRALFSALPKGSFILPVEDSGTGKSKRRLGPHISIVDAEYNDPGDPHFKRLMLKIAGLIAPRHSILLRPIIGTKNNELLLVPYRDQIKVLREFRNRAIDCLGLEIIGRLDPHLSLFSLNPKFDYSELANAISSIRIRFNVDTIYTARTNSSNPRKVSIDTFRPRLQRGRFETSPYLMQSQEHTPLN